ncbi:hypothetical protein DICPUDRAFT_6598, partial [Dictyostelium purpureum]
NYYKKNYKEILKNTMVQLIFLAIAIGICAPISIIVYNSPPKKYQGTSISIQNTDLYFDPRNMSSFDKMDVEPNVYLNCHTHTYYSDGSLSPEMTIQYHILNGYNVMFMTDHNMISGGLAGQKIAQEKYSDQILVIPGIEWTNCRCHLNLIGIEEDVPLIKWPTNQEIKELIDYVHSKGGLVILNHYPWSEWAGLSQPSMQEWIEMGIDFLEVVNGITVDYQGIVFSKQNNLRYVTGTDLHFDERASGWTVLNVPINHTLSPTDKISSVVPYLTKESVLKALRDKSTQISFLFDAKGSIIQATSQHSSFNPKYTFYSAWINLGRLFHSYFELQRGMYSFVDGSCTDVITVVYGSQIACLVAWIIIMFFCFKFLFYILRKCAQLLIIKLYSKKKQ